MRGVLSTCGAVPLMRDAINNDSCRSFRWGFSQKVNFFNFRSCISKSGHARSVLRYPIIATATGEIHVYSTVVRTAPIVPARYKPWMPPKWSYRNYRVHTCTRSHTGELRACARTRSSAGTLAVTDVCHSMHAGLDPTWFGTSVIYNHPL